MNMDILELMLSRRSYRGTYAAQKVPRSDLVKIMDDGLASPWDATSRHAV